MPIPIPTDHELIALFKKGDEYAFTQLYDKYWKRLFATAANKLKDFYVAEELVQDLFSDLWARKDTLEIKGNFQAYLAVALKYQVINYQVKQKRERAYKLDLSKQMDNKDDSTTRYLEFEELKKNLALLVSQLPSRCQLTYKLSREAGLSQREIAAQLDISEKAVEHNLHRAKKTLKAGLKEIITTIVFFF